MEKVVLVILGKILLPLVEAEAEVLLMELVEKVVVLTMVLMDLHLKVETEHKELIREA